MRGPFQFTVDFRAASGRSRLGRVQTPHGTFQTPAFMPVGTQAAVKGLHPDAVRSSGAEILLSNTYHLWLRPGHDLVRSQGGLHRFMGWDAPILTDSGGYQVFSLSDLRTIRDDGVTFRSHIDGSPRFLGPAQAMEIQNALGSDIMMSFDECLPYPSSHEDAALSIERTRRWEEETLRHHPRDGRALFGIIQGGVYPDLRLKSAADLLALPFDGYAMGGLFIGEERSAALNVLNLVAPTIPENFPRYVMGVGTPLEIVDCVALGWDMFDCVLPTRNGRHGTAMTMAGPLRVKNAAFRDDSRPIEEGCTCMACNHFSRAYVRHLIVAEEMFGLSLLSHHNLCFMQRLMEKIRWGIREQQESSVRAEVAAAWTKTAAPAS